VRKFHAAILLLCLLAGLFLFLNFLSHPRGLWTALMHDRNGHYDYGLGLAESVEHGQAFQFFNHLGKSKVWPPRCGLLVAATQALTGNDWRAAVLPSLAGWVLMLFCVWFTAQKIAAPTGIGWAAGLAGLLFAALSPGGRFYATDVMLEGLGAGLTMLALACHALAAEDRDSESKWRTLAIVLTIFFFQKYNYWLIVLLAIAISEAGMLRSAIRAWLAGIDWKKTARAQAVEPLNWVLLALVILMLLIVRHGPGMFHIPGHDISLYPPNNFVTAAFAVLFLRVVIAMRRMKWKPAEAWQRMLWRWHVVPLSISFMVPQRLSVFVHFLSPANAGDSPTHTLPGAAVFYWEAFLTDYNAARWMGLLAAALACVALARFKTFGPGGRAVLICMLLGALLNILHPNNKSRYMHSWLPAVWTAAGVGAALLLAKVKIPRRGVVAGIGITALAMAGGRAAWERPPAAERAESNSDLNLSDAWLAAVKGSRVVAFFSTQSSRSFMEWTFLCNGGAPGQFEWPGYQETGSTDEFRAGFQQWIAQTPADAVVFLDVPPESPMFSRFCDLPPLRQEMETLMAGQKKFRQTGHLTFPGKDCAVTIWRAAPE
jgi:hypothetical protein